MASEAKTEEPTMEEILASIRRIISEDGDEEQAKDEPGEAKEAVESDEPAPAPPPAEEDLPDIEPEPEAQEAAAEEDVLELTEIVPDEGDKDLGQDDVDSLFDEEEDVVLVERQEEADETFEEPEVVEAIETEREDEGLISPAVASRASTSFASLAKSIRVSDPDTEPGTLEQIVRDMLRPMLQEWLDENLPSIVERLVQAEIDRVARKGRF